MDDKGRIKIVSSVDVFVAIFLLIVGILVLILGFGWLDTLPDNTPFSWVVTTPWIIIMLGITSIIYGIKRTIDDVLKVLILKPSQPSQQPRYPPPVQQTPVYQQQTPQQPRQ